MGIYLLQLSIHVCMCVYVITMLMYICSYSALLFQTSVIVETVYVFNMHDRTHQNIANSLLFV